MNTAAARSALRAVCVRAMTALESNDGTRDTAKRDLATTLKQTQDSGQLVHAPGPPASQSSRSLLQYQGCVELELEEDMVTWLD
jgi:hypothetical protein